MKFVVLQFIGAYLNCVVPVGPAGSIDLKADSVFGGIDRVASEMDAHAQCSILIFLWGYLGSIIGRKLCAVCAINLYRVVAVGCEDDETVRVVSKIRRTCTIWEKLIGCGKRPGAHNRARLRSCRQDA